MLRQLAHLGFGVGEVSSIITGVIGQCIKSNLFPELDTH